MTVEGAVQKTGLLMAVAMVMDPHFSLTHPVNMPLTPVVMVHRSQPLIHGCRYSPETLPQLWQPSAPARLVASINISAGSKLQVKPLSLPPCNKMMA